ncbi:hypothetical protein G647_06288 [Cladophialophora carrionii CBS 160.54]|uniref:Uncharacterized protein n=1 Tax=Cladophialophora carrionii CBS 160.54 TaxID=1279043 RepID=V9D5R6_9EURO|nr:uncharacterized protein G647_06288 [Cladophialophora carrionii CBS 160.54]ETI22215.1 hypothetical protein G647_06288 [Cladophialophora carrionii CBS 160.54]
MSSPPLPFNVSAELKALRHEKQNQDLRRLPPNATVRRRPLNHAPIADLRSSGAKAPKVVYVSRRTPAVAAIKRVKRYLTSIEKRALQNAGVGGTRERVQGPRSAAEKANEVLAKNKEEVLVKASGRAMAQALRVAEWFRTHEKDMLCNVEVRTGSVSTVDDIVEGDGDHENEDKDKNDEEAVREEQESVKQQYGDTTLELLGGPDVTTLGSAEQATSTGDSKPEGAGERDDGDTNMDDSLVKQSRRKRKKRKRQMYEADELPEARIRWVNTVEVAVSLQG